MSEEDEGLTFAGFVKEQLKETLMSYVSGEEEAEDVCPECEGDEGGLAIYCVECHEMYCTACAVRRHHPGTIRDTHSLEEICSSEDRAIKVITPLLDEILLLTILVFVFSHLVVGHDYLENGNVCMVTDYVRKGVVRIDTKAFYVLKTPLATYCNIEDSYWRLFLDLWVRNVVTDSDSLFLLATSFISAWLFTGAMCAVLVPISSVAYGLAFSIISHSEDMLLPRKTGAVKKLARLVKKLNVIDICSEGGECPPPTFRRTRPAMNFMEFLWYEQNRISRQFTHFCNATSGGLARLLTLPMYAAVVMRAVCMAVPPVRSLLHGICAFFLPSIMAEHASWFSHSTSDEYTDHLVGLAWSKIRENTWLANAGASLFLGAIPASAMVIVPLLLAGALFTLHMYQTYKFTKRWTEQGLREISLGTCKAGSGCQCACVQFFKEKEESHEKAE